MHQIAPNFADSTRVWIYQSSRPLTESETAEISQKLPDFAQSWAAHGTPLTSFGEVHAQQFIILGVDEQCAGASGCSIDKSTHFVEALEKMYDIGLFDRMTFAWLTEEGNVQTAPAPMFTANFRAGKLTPQTLVFDNLVANLGDLRRSWQKPIAESWHRRFV